jgi:hypothetical protein
MQMDLEEGTDLSNGVHLSDEADPRDGPRSGKNASSQDKLERAGRDPGAPIRGSFARLASGTRAKWNSSLSLDRTNALIWL